MRAFSSRAVELLSEMPWPGNVRELRNTVERLVILAPGDRVTASDVMALTSGDSKSGAGSGFMRAKTFADFRESSERAFLAEKLRENDWVVTTTARKLEMQRSNLYKKIEKHGLRRDD